MQDPVLITKNTYDAVAEEYSRRNLDNTTLPKKNMGAFISFLKERNYHSVLDVGCGNGRDAKYFSEQGIEVLGVDSCNSLLDIAKSIAPHANFVAMDMRNLEKILSSSFGGVWGSSSFLHVPKSDAVSTLAGFRRVLMPNGILYLSVKRGNSEELSSAVYNSPRFFANYELSDFKKLITENGFNILTDLDYATNPKWVGLIAEKRR